MHNGKDEIIVPRPAGEMPAASMTAAMDTAAQMNAEEMPIGAMDGDDAGEMTTDEMPRLEMSDSGLGEMPTLGMEEARDTGGMTMDTMSEVVISLMAPQMVTGAGSAGMTFGESVAIPELEVQGIFKLSLKATDTRLVTTA